MSGLLAATIHPGLKKTFPFIPDELISEIANGWPSFRRLDLGVQGEDEGGSSEEEAPRDPESGQLGFAEAEAMDIDQFDYNLDPSPDHEMAGPGDTDSNPKPAESEKESEPFAGYNLRVISGAPSLPDDVPASGNSSSSEFPAPTKRKRNPRKKRAAQGRPSKRKKKTEEEQAHEQMGVDEWPEGIQSDEEWIDQLNTLMDRWADNCWAPATKLLVRWISEHPAPGRKFLQKQIKSNILASKQLVILIIHVANEQTRGNLGSDVTIQNGVVGLVRLGQALKHEAGPGRGKFLIISSNGAISASPYK